MRMLAAVVFILGASSANAARPLPFYLDAYGYRGGDSDSGQCPYLFSDIQGAGTALTPTASGASAAADDGGAVLGLSGPFEFYGVAAPSWVVSTNGYLAVAASLDAENGGDFSNDCILPAVPDNAPSSNARIMVYHDDLDGTPGGGTMQSQYFASCPRPSDAQVSEACTVVQWSNWRKQGGSGTLTMQALLYHGSNEIVFQYASVDASAGASASVGLQNEAVDSAAEYSCGRPEIEPAHTAAHPFVASRAVCFFDPRFPAMANDVIFADGFDVPSGKR